MSWVDSWKWWLAEVSADTAYESVVTPLLLEVFSPIVGDTYLDLGCGEGRVMRTLESGGFTVVGVELSLDLARSTPRPRHVVVDSLPEMGSISDNSVSGAFSVLVLEHIADYASFFTSAARVVRPGGPLAIVSNHPAWTAPGSTPISDEDGEVLWRPGDYFGEGDTLVPAGDRRIVFHHRSMATLLNSASSAGWHLEKMIERPHHELLDQGGIPRLLACQWRLLPLSSDV